MLEQNTPLNTAMEHCFLAQHAQSWYAETISAVANKQLNLSAGDVTSMAEARSTMVGAEPYSNSSYISFRKGNVGIVRVHGSIVPRGESWHTIFGVSPLNVVKGALAEMDADPTITHVIRDYDTPGGSVSGLSDHYAYIKGMSTPTTTYVSGQCASAGYFTGCASKIVSSEMGMVGSIGTMVQFTRNDQALAQAGIEKVTLVSEQSPNKVATDVKNQSILQDDINQLAEIFIEHVADGRGVSTDVVKETFGKGGTFLAKQAQSLGMIDSVMTFDALVDSLLDDENKVVNSHRSEQDGVINVVGEQSQTQTTGESMNLDELQANHPELFAEAKKSILDAAKAEQAELDKAEAKRVSGITALAEDAKAMEGVTPAMLTSAQAVIDKAVANADSTKAETESAMYKAMCTAVKVSTVVEDDNQHGDAVALAAAMMGNTAPQNQQLFDADSTKAEGFSMADTFAELDKAGVINV